MKERKRKKLFSALFFNSNKRNERERGIEEN
jgi:hypothetical protein